MLDTCRLMQTLVWYHSDARVMKISVLVWELKAERRCESHDK